MRHRVLWVCMLLCAMTAQVSAQIRSISGVVLSSEDKRGVAGVRVTVKGNTKQGTITDRNGAYRFNIDANAKVLVFSAVGLQTVEEQIGDRVKLDVVLRTDAAKMGEVVVTALGVEKDKRSVNYAMQELNSKEIMESQQTNVVNSMQGRIAGVQITNAGGAPGASSSIIIRGGNSVDGNNEPLFIIDGVPLDNGTTTETGAGTSGLNGQLARSVSNSNRGIDINPDDIETISVLKGPSAAALYGVRAANGVVLITTKRGIKGVTKINFTSTMSYDVVNKLPEFQDQFKQGTGGFFSPLVRTSWGPRFQQGETVYDNVSTFFTPATAFVNTLTLSGADDKLNYFFSASDTRQNGIVPNTAWNRTSIRFNGGAKLNDKLSIQTSINYINSGGNRVLQGPGLFGGTGGFFVSMINWPRNDNMADWQNTDGSRRRLLTSLTADIDNPYFSVNKNLLNDVVDRLVANASVNYDVADWMNIRYVAGTDLYFERTINTRAPGSSLPGSQNGSIAQSRNFFQTLNSQLLVTFKKQLTEDLGVNLLLGNWVESNYTNASDTYSVNFFNPDFNSVNNTLNTENRIAERITERRLIGVFGELSLNYANKLYLSLRGRNDWSSTLPVANRSFFYPSVDVGYIFTEDFFKDSDILNYGKLRFSVASVGKDPRPYRTATALVNNTFIGGGVRNDFWTANPNLRSERTESVEIGAELRFFDNRLTIDGAVYQQKTYNQLIAPRISQASGGIFAYLNGGTVQNQGLEIAVNAVPVRTNDFRWSVGFNFTRNISKVVELPAVLSELNQSDAWVIDVARGSAFPGTPLQSIAVNDFLRDSVSGKVIINANGYPSTASSAIWNYGGNRQPDAIIGINNEFQYGTRETGRLTFSFLWDIRVGGKVLNGTDWAMTRAGMSMRTVDRYKRVVLDGVVRDATGNFVPNTTPVELTEGYFVNIYASSGANFVEDGSWVRLRTAALSYSFPSKWFDDAPVRSVDFTITGRNLLLFTKYTGMDPEVSASGAGVNGAGSNGMDFAGVPATRGVTFTLNVGF